MGEDFLMDVQTLVFVKGLIDKQLSELGIKGESAYEIAKRYGFEGTEEEWLESLKAESDLSDYLRIDEIIPLTEQEIQLIINNT